MEETIGSGFVSVLPVLAPLTTLVTVLTGVVFGILTLRQYRLARSLTAAVELVHTIQTPEFARSLGRVLQLPEDADSLRVIEDAEMTDAADVLTHGFESLGVLVYYRILPLHLVDNMIGGSVRACWRRLHVHFEERRASLGTMLGEWFEWLAERMEQDPAPGKHVGAATAHRHWRA